MAEFGDDIAGAALGIAERLGKEGAQVTFNGAKRLTHAGWVRILEARNAVAAQMDEGLAHVEEKASLAKAEEYVWTDFDFRGCRLSDGSGIVDFREIETDIIAQLKGAGAPEFDFSIKEGIGCLRYRAKEQREMAAAMNETRLAFRTRLEEAAGRATDELPVESLAKGYMEEMGMKPFEQMDDAERSSLLSDERFAGYAAKWAEEEGRIYRARGVNVRFTYVPGESRMVAEYPRAEEKAYLECKEKVALERGRDRAENLRKQARAVNAKGKEPFKERMERVQAAAKEMRAAKRAAKVQVPVIGKGR
ncbi:MAG: hypothetical protein IKF96_08965 [Eggerthellaceae bacterium]|nr:hypothetical protein [Eggerthellaceae bacterium]